MLSDLVGLKKPAAEQKSISSDQFYGGCLQRLYCRFGAVCPLI
jgi:hypothetical protein